MGTVLSGENLHLCLGRVIVSFFTSFIILWLASLILRKTTMTEEKPSVNVKIKRFLQKKKIIKITRTEIAGNPIAWRDYNKKFSGKRGFYSKFIAAFVIIFTISWICTATSNNYEEAIDVLLVSNMVIMLLASFMCILSGAIYSIVKEKEHKTMEIILSTGLNDSEIIFGKIYAIIKHTLPFLICTVCLFVPIFFISKYKSAEFAIVAIFWCSGYFIFTMGLGILISLFSKNSQSALSKIVLLMFIWHILSNITWPNTYGKIIPIAVSWGIAYATIGIVLILVSINFLRSHSLKKIEQKESSEV